MGCGFTLDYSSIDLINSATGAVATSERYLHCLANCTAERRGDNDAAGCTATGMNLFHSPGQISQNVLGVSKHLASNS